MHIYFSAEIEKPLTSTLEQWQSVGHHSACYIHQENSRSEAHTFALVHNEELEGLHHALQIKKTDLCEAQNVNNNTWNETD